MFSTYRAEDVELLLKDITGLVEPMGTREREHAIQAGRHYCEMLPIEYEPTSPYLAAYEKARTHYAPLVAATVATAAEAVYRAKKTSCTRLSGTRRHADWHLDEALSKKALRRKCTALYHQYHTQHRY